MAQLEDTMAPVTTIKAQRMDRGLVSKFISVTIIFKFCDDAVKA